MIKNENWESSFSVDEYKSPRNDFAPVYGWVWNGEVTKEDTDAQLDEMARLGIRYIYVIAEPKMFRPITMPTFLEPDYLTPPYFEEFKYAMDGAKARGMKLWLYDEGGWPSGGACGKVLISHPEYARQTLQTRTIILPAKQTYSPTLGTIASFINNTEIISDGCTFENATEITEYYLKRFFFNSDGNMTSDFPDVTMEGVTEEFIRITHDGYKPYLSHLLGKEMTAVFTDEPSTQIPIFRTDLAEKFEKENGYSILPYLPYLCGQPVTDDKTANAVYDWYNLCSKEFCQNYLNKEKKWCNKNDMALVGHMDIDNIPNGSVRGGNYNLMRALRCLDIPGVDAIWRQIFPSETSENNFFPRYASSAAAQSGSRFALTETAGVYGAGLTYNELRWALTFQAIRGINIYNLLLIPYRRKGFNMAGEMPSFTENQAHFGDLKQFNEYLERLSYISSIGARQCDIGLYLPTKDFYIGGKASEYALDFFQKAGFEMEDSLLDFDIIDDDVILDARLTSTLEIGFAKYKIIVIDKNLHIPDEVYSRLKEFEKNGGRVINRAEIPSLKSSVEIIGDKKGLRVSKRLLDNGELILLSNENYSAKTFILNNTENYILNPTDGSIRAFPLGGQLTLESGELIGLLKTDIALPQTENTVAFTTIELNHFTLRRQKRFVIGEMEFETEVFENDEAKPVSLGDWKDYVGEDYSGSCIYETDFDSSEENGVIIELGDVKTTAEVFINGKSCGTRVMKPYSFECNTLNIGKNSLSIRVTNTPANEYSHTKSFEKWQKRQLSPYFEKEQDFHKDSLPSGLYGPVTLHFTKKRKG